MHATHLRLSLLATGCLVLLTAVAWGSSTAALAKVEVLAKAEGVPATSPLGDPARVGPPRAARARQEFLLRGGGEPLQHAADGHRDRHRRRSPVQDSHPRPAAEVAIAVQRNSDRRVDQRLARTR